MPREAVLFGCPGGLAEISMTASASPEHRRKYIERRSNSKGVDSRTKYRNPSRPDCTSRLRRVLTYLRPADRRGILKNDYQIRKIVFFIRCSISPICPQRLPAISGEQKSDVRIKR